MGAYDGTNWYIDPFPLLLAGLLFVYIVVLISLDFLPHEAKPMRTCPKCGRRWAPLPHDSATLTCNLCLQKIPLGPFSPTGEITRKPQEPR